MKDMSRRLRTAIGLLAGLGAMPGSLFAVEQIGTVISAAPFILRGARVSTVGVPSWPLLPGDEIVTADTPVGFAFKDGSRIVLQPFSSARVEREGLVPAFHLLTCAAVYELKGVSAVNLYRGAKPEKPAKDFKGEYTVGCKSESARTSSAGVAAVGGAATPPGSGTPETEVVVTATTAAPGSTATPVASAGAAPATSATTAAAGAGATSTTTASASAAAASATTPTTTLTATAATTPTTPATASSASPTATARVGTASTFAGSTSGGTGAPVTSGVTAAGGGTPAAISASN